jgi:hypothetical protein
MLEICNIKELAVVLLKSKSFFVCLLLDMMDQIRIFFFFLRFHGSICNFVFLRKRGQIYINYLKKKKKKRFVGAMAPPIPCGSVPVALKAIIMRVQFTNKI